MSINKYICAYKLQKFKKKINKHSQNITINDFEYKVIYTY